MHPTRNWRMRLTLVGALTVLVVVAVILTVTRPSPKKLAAVAAPQPSGSSVAVDAGTTATPSTGTTATPGGAVAPATATTPATVAATATPNPSRDGCGFSLHAQATAPVGQCTVLEVGDSLGNDLGWGLAREVASTSGLTLIQKDVSATGLANSRYYDWPAELSGYLKQYHPQLVLICIGGDDEQGMDVNGSAVQFPSAAWQSAYLARVHELLSEAIASGAYVLWVGNPIMQQASYSQGMQLLDSLYEKAVASEARATFLSTWTLFANPQGQFQSTAVVNGSTTTLREADGIHYSLAGENVFATYVINQIASLYHVDLRPTNPAEITSWG